MSPIPTSMELIEVLQEANIGEYSARVEDHGHIELNGKQTAATLLAQGSDPEFFRLNENGEDTE